MRPLIYHNPDCGTSRNTLAMMIDSGEDPAVIEYLKHPPSRGQLVIDDTSLGDDELIDAMLAHPILINRPIVVTDKGARLCRPSERVLELLDRPVSRFVKEDGEVIHYPPNTAPTVD